MTSKAGGSKTPPGRRPEFAPWPSFQDEEIAAVIKVLESGQVNYWTGEEGRRFEEEFAEFAGCRFAVAVANGTLALELALRSLGIGPGDEVVTTSRTFIASASAAVMCGATPVFADVDPASQNLTADTVRRVLSPRTRAIVAVHLAGWPCDMDPLLALAREHGLKVVEDCAQAHGATYKGRPVGSLGDAAAFSFCQDKILTTGGEGGMLTTNDPRVWDRAWSFKDHGKNYASVFAANPPPGYRWLHDSFGSNWRLTEMQAAIGRVALKKLPNWVTLRRRNAAWLRDGLERVATVSTPLPPSGFGHAYYKFYTFVQPERLGSGWNRDRIMAEINARGVPCFSGSCSEIYREKAFLDRRLGPAGRLESARRLGDTSLMFLVHPTLSEEALDEMVRVATRVLQRAEQARPSRRSRPAPRPPSQEKPIGTPSSADELSSSQHKIAGKSA